MELTQQLREFAAARGLGEADAIEEGLREKGREFRDTAVPRAPSP
jgi:hypothetical protein